MNCYHFKENLTLITYNYGIKNQKLTSVSLHTTLKTDSTNAKDIIVSFFSDEKCDRAWRKLFTVVPNAVH